MKYREGRKKKVLGPGNKDLEVEGKLFDVLFHAKKWGRRGVVF